MLIIGSGGLDANTPTNRNIPLPAGSGWRAYETAMRAIVITIEALAGQRTDVVDPYAIARDGTGQALLPHQQQAIEVASA